MEVFPPKKDTDFEMVKEAALHIASLKPSFMSVTYGAGGSTKGNTIKLASEIQKQYQVPAMAHLTCVCATKESINTALTEMKQAGIENILALRGDIPKDYDGEVFTEFQHASQLVELIKKTGDFCVGGYARSVHPFCLFRSCYLVRYRLIDFTGTGTPDICVVLIPQNIFFVL